MADFDVVVIGSGPGGYVAAIRAAQLGLKTAIVEKEASLGGTCLNIGCIPSKVLLEASELFHVARDRMKEFGVVAGEVRLDLPVMMQRKSKIVKELTDGIRFLMKKNKIETFEGKGVLRAKDRVAVVGNGTTTEIGAKNILLATGSAPVQLPFLKFDGKTIVSSSEALSFESVPEHLVVIGAGAIGLEMGSVWRRLGAKVTVIEMLARAAPFSDEEAGKALERALKRQGLDFKFDTKVTAGEIAGGKVTVTYQTPDGKSEKVTGDRVLVSVGRKPYTDGLGLDAAGVRTDPKGFIIVDGRFRTDVATIYAIGDVIGGAMLAHKAEDEGVAAVEIMAGRKAHIDPLTIPNVIYTNPELAQVGLTEAQVKEKGIDYKTGSFPFRPNGRAKTLGETDGMVKFIAEAKTDRILGVHIVGPRASELIAEAVLAMEFRGSSEDVALTCHPHPTLTEVIREAALAVGGRAIHM